jgi:hypothetical protein
MVELDSCSLVDCVAITFLVASQHIRVLDAWVELLLPNVSRPNLRVSALVSTWISSFNLIGFRAVDREGQHHTGYILMAD